MWKNLPVTHYYKNLYFNRYSLIKNDFCQQLLSILNRSQTTSQLYARHQSTNIKGNVPKSSMHTNIVKRPLPNYLRDFNLKRKKHKQRVTPAEWFLLVIPFTAFAFGAWQVKRRRWKMGIIEDLEKKTLEPAIDFPDDLATLSSLEYRRVKVTGVFDHQDEIFLGPRSLIENDEATTKSGILPVDQSKKLDGHCVITPFILSDNGKRILVNRGWVPLSMMKPNKRLQGQIENEVEITGVVRLKETRGLYVKENIPNSHVFHYRDVETMAKQCNTLPVLIEAIGDSTVPGGPIGGQSNVSIWNHHMTYIISGYGVAALTTLLWCMNFLNK